MNILDIDRKVLSDSSIAGAEYHTHQPLTSRYDANDEIRIPVQDDLCTLPSESYLYIEGSLTKPDGTPSTAKFCNNGIAFLFSQIRYELNGVTVDTNLHPGLTATIKGYLSFSPNESRKYQNGGWCGTENSTLLDINGNFNACLPLKTLLGFAEDYRKVILNIRQELVLVRSNSDKNAVVGPETEVKITLNKIYWKLPHITPGLTEEVQLTKYIGRSVDTQIAFRNWQLHIFPSVNQTKTHSWAVATINKTSSPRYVILAFQTDREGYVTKDMSQFDDCKFQDIRVYLNNERYPYDNLNIDFTNNKIGMIYEMYAAFQNSYYGKDVEPLLDVNQFKTKVPLIVIDTSKQKEHIQPASITLRIEFETSENIPVNTNAYCLVLHDTVYSYNALTRMVKQL